MNTTERKHWTSNMPSRCDLCDCKLTDGFVDAKMRRGCWAIMCKSCFSLSGVGLGQGKGQEYDKDGFKIAG